MNSGANREIVPEVQDALLSRITGQTIKANGKDERTVGIERTQAKEVLEAPQTQRRAVHQTDEEGPKKERPQKKPFEKGQPPENPKAL